MRKFMDSAGREWNISLTGATMRSLKDDLREKNINLWEPLLPRGSDPVTHQGLDPRRSLQVELQVDIPLFYDVLEAIVAPQLKAADVDKDDPGGFGDSMAGDHIFAALTAFHDEWRDFFRTLRPETAAAMAKVQDWWNKAVKAAEAKLTDPRIDAALNRKFDEAMSNVSSNLLASLDSIPTTGPSES